MRLDKYLKVSRLVKRRTIANELCDAKHVDVNGKPARASYEIKPEDEITITMGAHKIRARVLSVQEYATKENAAGMFELLEDR
ncbi:MAG: RNA-binding S4 domain-containing protein [Oscillospiraceae bacterium]|jgi:ribosomal 50S subunit-recycling heat shock protein|nr:RNA-binding S4 domain-containing protein [Oscillospiraceae bacterium]